MTDTTTAAAFRRALITGGYSGVGAAFASRLAHDGSSLILVARDGDALETFASGLRERYGVDVDTMACDLATSEGLQLVESLIDKDSDLDLLINNAAFAGYQSLTALPLDLAEKQIHLQVLAVVRLALVALPGMQSRGTGTIINVSSTLGFHVPPPGKRGIYPSTKAFVTMFSEHLSVDLEGTGIQIQALCPGLVATPFHERDGRDVSQIPESWFMDPKSVVEASLAGLALGEVVCVPGLQDLDLLEDAVATRRRLFEATLTGTPASRYSIVQSGELHHEI